MNAKLCVFTIPARVKRELGHMSLENTACNVSHSINAKLCVFTIPVRVRESYNTCRWRRLLVMSHTQ